MFMESKTRIEVVVFPLAIYREATLHISARISQIRFTNQC
jgi:hypothetical protein